ncbi:hypothetical protein IWW50_000117 [Coemansia erecta]|nr:hypothetical protein GGF43_000124 [Coemansia sp. RSA 2618]KAJ2830671.1 hypothetical protein IWW50_000117 [Coemansia erecta]
MPGGENDLTELFIRSFKCTGDVPPALVGSSVTYLDGYAYVFGGRALHSGKLLNDMYACDLRSYHWRRIDISDGADDRKSTTQGVVGPPAPRFFHSATAFRQYLVVFGGMGLDSDPEAPTSAPAATPSQAATTAARSGSIQDDRNQQSFQVRTSKTLLGDMAVFDTRLERWVSRRALDGTESSAAEDTASRPSARYAHLSTLLGSRLLIVGGQDLEEQYVEELNVFDLQVGRWVLRSPFPRAVGLYRSFIASVPSSGSTLLYSNYSFASVKRALYRLSAPPDCTLQEISDQLDGTPPGLRFPRGHRIDPRTLLMTGTLISTEGHSELSLWTLDAESLLWQPVRCGAKFRAGSWNQSVVDPRSNTLVLFGDSRRDLTYDYQRRRLNYGEIRAVDLRALGFLRAAHAPAPPAPIAAAPLAAARTAATGTLAPQQPAAGVLAFEVGAQLLHFALFSDAEIATPDGGCVAEVNSGLLRRRWPKQAQTWLAAGSRAPSRRGSVPDTNAAARPPSQHTAGRPESSLLSGSYDDDAGNTDEGANNDTGQSNGGARRFVIDGSREAIYLLVFYLYTGIIDPAARFGLHQGAEIAAAAAAAKDEMAVVRVLGELLVIARRYTIDALALQTVNLLRWRVSAASAPLIFDAALRAEHQGLQARAVIAVRDHVAELRADRQSSLYTINSSARASLLRYFPKLANDDLPIAYSDAERMQYPSTAYSGNPMTPDMRHQQQQQQQQQQYESRQRAPSDAIMGSDPQGHPRNSMFPSPSSSSGSPASTMRGNLTRSPYTSELANPRRPWEATTMASPVINSPASSRFSSTQSPEIRGGGGSSSMSNPASITNNTGDGMTSSGNKRMSGIMHLATQPLPEDIAINYGQDQSVPTSSASDTVPQTSQSQSQSQPQTSHSSHSSKRVSRYLGNITGGISAPSIESVSDRRTSDASSANEVSLQSPHQQQQQQQQQSSSSRSFFRPWSKVKKLTSSNQVSTDSLPPLPSHASTYSANSAQ